MEAPLGVERLHRRPDGARAGVAEEAVAHEEAPFAELDDLHVGEGLHGTDRYHGSAPR